MLAISHFLLRAGGKRAGSLLDAHRDWLAGRAPQVSYSARILWQELRVHRGFTGSYVIVRGAVAPLRVPVVNGAAEFNPGRAPSRISRT